MKKKKKNSLSNSRAQASLRGSALGRMGISRVWLWALGPGWCFCVAGSVGKASPDKQVCGDAVD